MIFRYTISFRGA